MLNTEDLYDEVTDLLLQRRGTRFTLDLKHAMMGRQSHLAIDILRKWHGIEDSVELLLAEVDEIFVDLLPEKIGTMPGLHPLLDRIDALKLPKGVATSSRRNFAERALGLVGILGRFDFLLCAEDVTMGKPHPEVYLKASERLNCLPENMLVFEDSVTGSKAASAAGAFTVAVPTLHCRGLDYSHASVVVESLEDPRVAALLSDFSAE